LRIIYLTYNTITHIYIDCYIPGNTEEPYKLDEFNYIKEKIESKYGFKFKDYYKRLQTLEEWNKMKDSLEVIKKPEPIKPTQRVKLRTIKDDDWSKASASELSPTEALARFYRLKAEEKRQQLLEEVRNVEFLIS
jgi:hypothetical protein